MEATLDSILLGFSVAFRPDVLLYAFLGCVIGTLVGMLPGIGPLAGISILLPVTFGLDATTAIIMLAAILYGAAYGGTTTAVLLKIPGEASSIATTLDGYEMAKQGRAGPALGISAFGSFIAGTFALIALMLVAPSLASVAIAFGPAEYFSLMVLGLVVLTFLTQGSMAKALLMACTGVVLGLIGLDSITAQPRLTFGRLELIDGIGLVPVVMALVSARGTGRIAGLVPALGLVALGQVLLHGATLVIGPRFDPTDTLSLVAEGEVTVVPIAPPVIAAWLGLEDDELRSRLTSVRLLLSGAAPLAEESVRTFERRTGIDVEQGYGLTEAAPIVTSTIGTPEHKPGSSGRAVPGVELKLVDDGGREVHADDRGDDPLPPLLDRRAVHRHGARLVRQGQSGEQDAIARAGRRVEDVAGGQDDRLPRARMWHERPREGQHDREEQCELERREDHWARRW